MAKKQIQMGLCPEACEFRDNLTILLKKNEVLTSMDDAALNLLVNTYHNYIMATRMIEAEGYTIRSPRGEIKTHPAVKIQLDAQIQLSKLMDNFGLNPKARKEIQKSKDKASEATPIDNFLAKFQ